MSSHSGAINIVFERYRIDSFLLPLSEPQSRFGDNPPKCQVICPQNGAAVLKGLTTVCVLKPIVTFSFGGSLGRIFSEFVTRKNSFLFGTSI